FFEASLKGCGGRVFRASRPLVPRMTGSYPITTQTLQHSAGKAQRPLCPATCPRNSRFARCSLTHSHRRALYVGVKPAAEKSQAETIAELNARCDGPNQFENFDRAFRTALTVPKSALLKEEARQKRARARKRAKKSA